MALNAIINNISVISRSVLSMEETGVPRENHCPAVCHLQTLSHNVVSSTPRLSGIQTHNVSGDRYWWHNYKSNYHTITNTTAPCVFERRKDMNILKATLLQD